MQNQFQPYQQGMPAQQQQQMPLQQKPQHTVKFYKSGLFLFASASGRIQRDLPHMEGAGWQLQYAASLGRNILLRQVIVTIWTR